MARAPCPEDHRPKDPKGPEAYSIREVGSQTNELRVRLGSWYHRSTVIVRVDIGTVAFPARPPAVHIWVSNRGEWVAYEKMLAERAKHSYVHVRNWTPGYRLFIWHLIVGEVRREAEANCRATDNWVCWRLLSRKLPADVVGEICCYI